MAKESPTQVRTVNVSPQFADMLIDLARGANKSIREYCDEDLTPMLRAKYKATVKRKLAAIELGGES